jgi:hypothetical protein
LSELKAEPYEMKISRTTIDKLGIKLYDKASAVVSELIANSYDADAEKVTVKIPLSRWLATRRDGEIIDHGLEIVLEDDGHGMTPDVINDFYLKVGTNPREDKRRGPKSLEKSRPRMGRKGIGKLAPFGICKIIEVKSAGGEETADGYRTAHFIMNYDDIVQETDAAYTPTLGEDDRTYSEKRGTTVKLRTFLHRRTPDLKTFDRQMARRFGLELPDFQIEVVDTETRKSFTVGELAIKIDKDTKIVLDDRPVELDDGTKLPVKGWVAYAEQPYSNVEVAGVRIYARRKLVSCTRDFGLKAGFTGEFTIRSYLVGVVHADWLDPDGGEDLIQSGRQDILWDSEIGAAFQKWGQDVLKELGRKSWSPVRERTWEIFMKKSNIEKEAKNRFADKVVFDSAMKLAKVLGRGASRAAMEKRPEYVNRLKELVLTVAPHKMIVDKLEEVEKALSDRPLEAIAKIFQDTKLAEAASLGQIAIERIDAIKGLEKRLSPEITTEEASLQKLLEGAPWLINPQWTMLQANKTFDNMQLAFERWWQKEFKVPITTSAFAPKGEEKKRPDFIMLHIGGNIEIVEIKRPEHALTDEEFDRLLGYFQNMGRFLDLQPDFKAVFPKSHITLVCDKLNLDPTHMEAYRSLKERNDLKKKTWEELLNDTKTVHVDFIERQRSIGQN